MTTRRIALVAIVAGSLGALVPGVRAQRTMAPYFPPDGAWATKAPDELGMDAAALAAAVRFAESRESTRAMDFSDQERTFGSMLGSVPTRRSTTNGLVIFKGYVVASFGDPTASRARRDRPMRRG